MPSLSDLPNFQEYYRSHGWTIDSVRAFDLRFSNEKIVFPLHDWEGNRLPGVLERRFNESPRWMPVPDPDSELELTRHVYGLYQNRIPICSSGTTLVVESAACVVALHGLGFPVALATMGTGLSQRQALFIRRMCSKILVWVDRGAAGEIMLSKVKESAAQVRLRVVNSWQWFNDPSDAISQAPDQVTEFLLRQLKGSE